MKRLSAGQDAAAAAIRRARSSFVPPADCQVNIARVRSHSSRQRCINDLKITFVPKDVGKRFARIASDKVYDGYGQLTDNQVAASLARNSDAQNLWKSMHCEANLAAA